VDLCDGYGSQHSSFMAREQTNLKKSIGKNQFEQEMHLRRMRLAHFSGHMHQPSEDLRFVPIAMQPNQRSPKRQANLEASEGGGPTPVG
jgi:hypothetical protein